MRVLFCVRSFDLMIKKPLWQSKGIGSAEYFGWKEHHCCGWKATVFLLRRML